ncbi:MAG TPA: prepilin peptidase [Acidiferrobacteraceae bacterium]|nr:prepilin peptidase [Acidiferrobacteraceae bacterium]HEX19648.1 prepilin peptidase [Acidiferrobacteraceae bacterium]
MKNNRKLSSLYPEKQIPHENWLDRMGVVAAGYVLRTVHNRISRFSQITDLSTQHKQKLKDASDEELRNFRNTVRLELLRTGIGDLNTVAKSFALIREVSQRELGMFHYDVQLIGGYILLNGLIAEMETGEGKTLTATLPAATVALAGIPVHVITVNDYLAERDATTMRPVYERLGLTVGIIKEGMGIPERQQAYACDITYCTNKEVAFDYLKDRLVMKGNTSDAKLRLERLYGRSTKVHRLIMRGLHFALVDEADSVMIDEARTPLVISGTTDSAEEQEIYRQALAIANALSDGDFVLQKRERSIELTEQGKATVREHANQYDGLWKSKRRSEELVQQALSAIHLFQKDTHYLVRDDKIEIVDEYTGRVMADRSWERGLHQLIETKEEVEISGRRETLARISYQRFFRKYMMLSGMTGTAKEVEKELWAIYRLHVVQVPTNRPAQRQSNETRIFHSIDEKYDAILESVQAMHTSERPVLIGAKTVETSEALSRLLTKNNIDHQVLSARQDANEAEIIELAGEQSKVTVATNMAGRGTDIKLKGETTKLGGLHVIVTELHEARRIDRQLIGRCGRQGDKGSYEKVLSFEDDLAKNFIPSGLHKLAVKFLHSDKKRLRKFAGWILHLSQYRAEYQHARTRYDLFKHDEEQEKKLAFTGKG